MLSGLALLLAACSGGDTNEGVMETPPPSNNPGDGNNDPPPGPISYQEDIRIIIQSNCTSCHSDPPTQDAPMALTTYEAVRSAVNNRGLLTRINSTTSPMPPTGRLPAATRQIIEDWVDLGFAE